MSKPFSSATAEQVVSVVEAVVVSQETSVNVEFVMAFVDLQRDQAEGALQLAVDIGFLQIQEGNYSVSSPLCRFLVTPSEPQKAALLRLILETYPPFVVFRERLIATDSATTAADQTRITLDLDAHRETVKETLVSLGTFSNALRTEGSGKYKTNDSHFEDSMVGLAAAVADLAGAEAMIRSLLGEDASSVCSREDVVIPLADSFMKAKASDALGAVVRAGNAVESYLSDLAGRLGVTLGGAPGINAKLDKFDQQKKLPKKLIHVGKYLGHVRNAADHGVDVDVNAPWTVRQSTGHSYVHVACSFIASCTALEKGKAPEI